MIVRNQNTNCHKFFVQLWGWAGPLQSRIPSAQ